MYMEDSYKLMLSNTVGTVHILTISRDLATYKEGSEQPNPSFQYSLKHCFTFIYIFLIFNIIILTGPLKIPFRDELQSFYTVECISNGQ